MTEESMQLYARLHEYDGKIGCLKTIRTEKNAVMLDAAGFLPYLGIEKPIFPMRKTVAYKAVEIDGKIITARIYEDQCMADYDNAMEDYIHQVAVDRGYTRREPSSYDNDPYPRFAQDAKDFKAFRSAVMLYALPILNEYLATGNAPTLAEFKAGFPKIVWTYQEEV